ncbi:MAG: hypothetical protein LLF97_12685 [Planctomycetaceae bacterium]|nr:hypothetical protein [Planctomycetaceae bacterium]
MKRKKTVAIVVISLLVIVGVVWWARSGEDPAVANLREKIKELGPPGPPGKGPPPSHEKMDELHKAMDQLTPEQRRQVMEPMHREMEQRMKKKLDEFFALSKDKRKDFLDKEIAEMEKRHKEMEANRPKNDRGPGGPPGGLNMSAEQRSMRHNEMLDRHSPQDRTRMGALMEAMEARRAELGLPSMRPPGPPPH